VTIYVAHEGQKAAQVAVPPFGSWERFTGDLAEHDSKDEAEFLAANQNDNCEPQKVSSSLRAGW
jgi:hypothetical protein